MPVLKKIETDVDFTPPPGEVVTFYAEENGKVVLKVKKSDGTVIRVTEGD